MKSRAPGKLILSGEHSAVYGAPAIALAVNRHIECHIKDTPDHNGLSWLLPQTGWQGHISWVDLQRLVSRLDKRFTQYEQEQLAAGDILEEPQQLALYAIALCLSDQLPEHIADKGIRLEITSELPLGSGMGSSAALSAAILTAGHHYFSNSSLTTGQLFQQVRYCERLCHGRGGLIDAATVSYGGLVQVESGEVSRVSLQLGSGWFYINSGNPSVGTGECVAQVRRQFAESGIWQDFADTTLALIDTLQKQDDPTALLRKNHRLLQQIGVVPEPVQQFIGELEQLGGAGKISGAGAVKGDGGGAIIAFAPGLDLTDLCQRYGYSFMPIEEDSSGACIID